jgi:hypothetical protein
MVLLVSVALVGCGGGGEINSTPETSVSAIKEVAAASSTTVTYTPGPSELNIYTSAMAPILQRWEDTCTLAGSTQRIALSGVISQMQLIKRDAQVVTVPANLKEVHNGLLDSMGDTIQGYLYFLTQTDDSIVDLSLLMGENRYNLYELNVFQVKNGLTITTLDDLMNPTKSP